MLDLRKLRLLRELHARGTVGAVAEALAFSPSAVSQQLAQLQREAGVPLTERVGRRLRLTDAGLRLVAHAESLLAQLETAEAELQQAAGVVRGTLRVGAMQTPLLSIVPDALRLLGERHPEVRVDCVESEPEESLPALALGELDLAVAEEYEDAPRHVPPGLVRDELCRDAILCALPAGHPLARRGEPVRLAELAGEAWTSTRPETQWSEMVDRVCHVAGFAPDIRFRANDVAIMAALAAAGHAVALLPALGWPERDPGITALPLAEGLSRTMYAFHRASAAPRPAVQAVVRALQDAATESGPSRE